MPRTLPPLSHELELVAAGLGPVCGIDEAGRGPLFGPLVCAAVILDTALPPEAYDSKSLSPAARSELAEVVRQAAVSFGIGEVSAAEIDAAGMSAALTLGVGRALANLSIPARFALVDGPHDLTRGALPSRCLIKGETHSRSIAAASVLAKVRRDEAVAILAERFPQYGLERHRGYGTPEHLAALAEHGPTPEHRASFAPVRALLS